MNTGQNCYKPRRNLCSVQPGSMVVFANDNEMARVNEGRRVSSKNPLLAIVEEFIQKEPDKTRFMYS